MTVAMSSRSTNLNAKIADSFRKSVRQYTNILPTLLGVILLIGLFNTLISKESLVSVFSGNSMLDTVVGACFGGVLAGNTINSYVIGDQMLDYDVGLYAVTALIIAWAAVGLVQLPAEIAALGKRFALLRNAVSFVAVIPIAILTVTIFNLIEGKVN